MRHVSVPETPMLNGVVVGVVAAVEEVEDDEEDDEDEVDEEVEGVVDDELAGVEELAVCDGSVVVACIGS
jgi:hypothetical protein